MHNRSILPIPDQDVQTENLQVPPDTILQETSWVVEPIDDDVIDEIISNAEPHPALQLVRRIRGAGSQNIRVNIYADHESAFARLGGGSTPSGIGPMVKMWPIDDTTLGEEMPWQMSESNKHGFAVSWCPNLVDADTKEVTEVVAIAADMDDGRWSPEMGGPEPDVIVQSKNGDHCYWVTETIIDLAEAISLSRLAAIKLRADPAAASPKQPLRLPGFKHQKEPQDPFDVHISHESQRSTKWTVAKFVEAWGRDVPSEEEWNEYKSWYQAAKLIGRENVGDFQSPEWSAVRDGTMAYLDLLLQFRKLVPKNSSREMPKWEAEKAPEYWWSLVTGLEFVETCLRIKGVTGVDPRPSITPELRQRMNPNDLEWMDIEPKLRVWVAKTKKQLLEAGEEKRVALKDDPEKVFVFPPFEPFDPDKITRDEVKELPPLGTRPAVRTQGSWDMRTVKWVELLSEAGIYRSSRGDGWHDIRCPWAELHSDASKDSAGVVDPAGGKSGGFNCFHSHGHTTKDLMEWLVDELGEETVARYCDRSANEAPAEKPGGKQRPGPQWPVTVKRKDGSSIPVPHAIENTRAMLDFYQIDVRYDLMRHKAEYNVPGAWVVSEASENAGWSYIRTLARKHGLQVAAVEDHLSIIQAENGYHPVYEWMMAKPWDGRDRVGVLLDSLSLAPGSDRDLTLTLLRTWLVTAAKAVSIPGTAREGIAAQGVLVLQGSQDACKTRWLMSLLPPGLGWAKEGVLLDPSSRDSVQRATRYAVCELGELDATFRKADIARLKSFITEKTDTYRSAYERREEEYCRRTVFAGSVNPTSFLMDSTGNRRFWTVPVTSCNVEHGLDLQQLWAQAAELARQGHPIWLEGTAKDKLNESNKTFENIDPLESSFDELFEIDPAGRTPQSEMTDTIRNAAGGMSQNETRRLLSTLRERIAREGLKTRKSNGVTLWPVTRRLVDDLDGVTMLDTSSDTDSDNPTLN